VCLDALDTVVSTGDSAVAMSAAAAMSDFFGLTRLDDLLALGLTGGVWPLSLSALSNAVGSSALQTGGQSKKMVQSVFETGRKTG